MVFRKGFVGPLGDDIPSIFPIVAGVLLFIGTLSYAIDTINEKNAYFDVRRAALGLSYIATDKGVVSENVFAEKCGSMKKYGDSASVKFLVTLKRFCTQVSLTNVVSSAESPYNFADSESAASTWLHCANAELPSNQDYLPPPKNSVLLSYPIAVPCPFAVSATNGLGVINVIVWR